MSTPTAIPSPSQPPTWYPPEGFGAPKNRHGHSDGGVPGLPAGTTIFSADNHISVADDIFYERFPEELKGAAPRIWYEDGAYMVGMKGKAWTGGDFGRVLMQYDDLADYTVFRQITSPLRERVVALHARGDLTQQ